MARRPALGPFDLNYAVVPLVVILSMLAHQRLLKHASTGPERDRRAPRNPVEELCAVLIVPVVVLLYTIGFHLDYIPPLKGL
ncbi:hypothetical protein [Sinorhizobium psoraleae]|uniref:Uncharacterized protein n=1 Tax=Sinorhizobium psoraleae TaxID=520838 RepID=A0ABT4KAG9_9HYPH|nr:hypothetical protein [Sinorhizobium psoraleae]MCZ4088843.1 hypothetical protein [Sinorhizobium psoraleae]